jgi:hypothetical protein
MNKSGGETTKLKILNYTGVNVSHLERLTKGIGGKAFVEIQNSNGLSGLFSPTIIPCKKICKGCRWKATDMMGDIYCKSYECRFDAYIRIRVPRKNGIDYSTKGKNPSHFNKLTRKEGLTLMFLHEFRHYVQQREGIRGGEVDADKYAVLMFEEWKKGLIK